MLGTHYCPLMSLNLEPEHTLAGARTSAGKKISTDEDEGHEEVTECLKAPICTEKVRAKHKNS